MSFLLYGYFIKSSTFNFFKATSKELDLKNDVAIIFLKTGVTFFDKRPKKYTTSRFGKNKLTINTSTSHNLSIISNAFLPSLIEPTTSILYSFSKSFLIFHHDP